MGCPGHCSLPAPHLMQEHPTVTTATCPDTAQCSLVDRTLTSDTCPDPHPSSWQDRSWALATPVWSACNVGVAGARQHLSPTPRRHIARAVGPRPAPAHLAASAVQGGWVPAAAGRGGAAARWEVADGTGCEVTCTRLREAGGGRRTSMHTARAARAPSPPPLRDVSPLSKLRLGTAPGPQHGRTPRLGSSRSRDKRPRDLSNSREQWHFCRAAGVAGAQGTVGAE